MPVRLTRIYTRGGDGGETSLADGQRVAKHDARVEAVGAVEEANASLGFALSHLEAESGAQALRTLLARVQNELFDLGADLSRDHIEEGEGETKPATLLRILPSQVERLETEIDDYNRALAPLNSFILPGGNESASRLHLARTSVRAAERRASLLATQAPVNPAAFRYLNRLSDLLFVLARHANADGADDVLWRPGATRPGTA